MPVHGPLFDELFSEILRIPVVDVHNHLNPEALAPRSIDDIVFYHYIVTELASSGMPWEELEGSRGVERLQRALRYIRRIRNTSTYWCLMGSLRDLYGFEGSYIDEKSWRLVAELVEKAVGDEARALRILRERVPVKKSILTIQPLEPLPKYDPQLFTGALRMDSLVPGMTPDSLRRLEEVTGVEVRDPDGLAEALQHLVKKFEGHVVAITFSIQPDDDFYGLAAPHSSVAPYIEALRRGRWIGVTGRRLLNSFAFEELVRIAGEKGLVVQMMLGVKRPLPGASPPDYALVVYRPEQVVNLGLLLARHPETRFDIIIADPLLNHQVSVIAKNYPNSYLSGYWWFSMYPEYISTYLRTRLQMLPYTKIHGFFSDAYVADWVYGKALLAKRELAHTLAVLVEKGYLDKGLALEIAEALLHRNAEELYRL